MIKNHRVKVVQSTPQIQKNTPVVLPVRKTFSEQYRTINIPGSTIHNKTYIQPILTRQYVNVNVQRQPTKRINHTPIVAPVIIQTKIKNKRIVVPGRRIMNQTIIQPKNTIQRVRVNLLRSAPITQTRAAIIKPTIKRRNVKTKYHNIVYKVPIQRTITKVQPHIVKVNDIKTVFVPVDENGQQLSGAAAANVLDSEGFVFGESGYANSMVGKNLSGSIMQSGNLDGVDLGKWTPTQSMPGYDMGESVGYGQGYVNGNLEYENMQLNSGSDSGYESNLNMGEGYDMGVDMQNSYLIGDQK